MPNIATKPELDYPIEILLTLSDRLVSEVSVMAYFLITFLVMVAVIGLMAIGVMFGRHALKGSCGGTGNCICKQKCDKRLKLEAEQAAASNFEQKV